MAAHGGQPGSYTGYVITKLIERLHGAKHWLVRHLPHLQKPYFVGLHRLAAHVWRHSLAVTPPGAHALICFARGVFSINACTGAAL